MLCPKCQQRFETFLPECPDCKIKLVDTAFLENISSESDITIDEFTELLRQHGGTIVVPMVTTLVDWERKMRFPKFGYGYAWSEKMRGVLDQRFLITLDTVEIGRKNQWNILMLGYGFAWAKRMQGTMGGLHFSLDTVEIDTTKNWLIIGFGYGFGWAKRMTGQMAPDITIEMETTAIDKKKESVFPGFGFGYAWVQTANLTFSLNNNLNG